MGLFPHNGEPLFGTLCKILALFWFGRARFGGATQSGNGEAMSVLSESGELRQSRNGEARRGSVWQVEAVKERTGWGGYGQGGGLRLGTARQLRRGLSG